jgi:uncharacterized coiled-coil protein SlyX
MLAPDVTATEQSLSDVQKQVAAVTGYIQNLNSLDLESLGWLAVKAAYPEIYNDLQTAQQHAASYPQLSSLIPTISQGIISFNSVFQPSSEDILNILTASSQNPNGQPTSAQQQGLTADFQALLKELTTEEQTIQSLVGPTQTFSDQLSADYTNLVNDEGSLNTTIASLNKQIANDQQTINNSPPLNVLGHEIPNPNAQMASEDEIGKKLMLGALTALLDTIESFTSQNETTAQALSGVLTMWQTLIAKYNDVITALQAGQTSGILQEGDVKSAQDGWSQLVTYAKSLT